MAHWFEVWTRPGDPNFGRVLDDPASRVGTLHDGVNLLGDGSMAMPSSLPDSVFDQILKIDQVTPANSVSSLVRVFSETDPTTPVFEWIPRAIVPPQNKEDPDVNVSGWSIKSVLDYARTEPVDWDGSDDFACSLCDWTYGGQNILGNPTLEDGSPTPSRWQLWTTASAGTFTLSDGTDTTAAIAFNATALTIETRLQTDIAAITDILVVGQGTVGNPWILELVTPAFGVTLTANGASLTPANSQTLVPEEVGFQGSAPWTEARHVGQNTLPFGTPDIWEVSTEQNHTPGGQYSIKVRQPSTSAGFAGVQQVVNVTPNGIYQASAWVYPTSATARFGIVIRTLGQDFIDSSTGGLLGGVTLTPNTWNELTITNLVIPDGINQVIFRVVQSLPGSQGTWYHDDMFLYEGFAATTIGAIVGDLYDTYTDPALQGTIYWDDGSGTDTPYLTLDFTDAVDSAGNAWDRSDISVRIYQRQTLLQVLEQAGASWNYEFRVVPDDVEAGTWLLQLYNPGGMMVDYSAAQTPAIQGGQGDTQRGIRRFLPSTDFMVEGLGRVSGRARDANLMAALGKIGAQRLARELPDQTAVSAAAQEDASDAVASGLTYPYVLTIPQDTPPGADVPLDAYVIGDALTIHDPPEVDDVGRLWDVVATFSAEQTEWEVQFLPLSISGGSP